MSKVDEYTGNGMIVVSDGEVWAVDDSGLPDVIGEIGRVELSIEMPENLIGIYRVEHIMLFDEDGKIINLNNKAKFSGLNNGSKVVLV